MKEYSLSDILDEFGEKALEKIGVPTRFLSLGTISYIAQGSTCDVYHIRGERDYALKIIMCEGNDRKFENACYEIRLMERLSKCTGTVRIVDSEIIDRDASRFVCILEEYCTPLSQYLKENPVSYSSRVRMLSQLCDALIQCRNAGVLHLDIQHGNLFVDDEGRLKLGDFGSSLLIADLYKHTNARGTFSYMAPEVYREGAFSEQSDIYSIGMLLYRLMEATWRKPFRHVDDLQVYMRLAGTPVPDVNLGNGALRELVMNVIHKACAFDPKHRISNFEAMKDSLELLFHEIIQKNLDDTESFVVMLDPRLVSAIHSVSVAVSAGINDFRRPGFDFQLPTDLVLYPLSHVEHTVNCASLKGGGSDSDGDGAADDLWADSTFDIDNSVPLLSEPMVEIKSCVCRLCGARLNERSKFCSECGTPAPWISPPIQMERVDFSAVAPRKLVKNQETMISVVVYEKEYRHVVDEIRKELGDAGLEQRGGMAKISENAHVRITLSASGIQIPEDSQEMLWSGGYLVFRYFVVVPKSYRKMDIRFKANVYVDGILVTRIEFKVSCVTPLKQNTKVRRTDIKSAFVSYASKDKGKVATLIQGMRRICPNAQIFFDKECLKAGDLWERILFKEIEERDVFYLCWSRNASKSKWVEKEWRYAYDKRGEEIIEPIALEHTKYCPPPEELKHKHFDDRMLYFADDEEEPSDFPPKPTTITIGI